MKTTRRWLLGLLAAPFVDRALPNIAHEPLSIDEFTERYIAPMREIWEAQANAFDAQVAATFHNV